MHRLIGLTCALAIGALSVSAAQAQSQCAPRKEIVQVLAAKYQENRQALGIINDKAVMEVYISPQGTWTMVVTNEAGMSCIMAAGESWNEKPTQVAGPLS
jgi:hypothetical protein